MRTTASDWFETREAFLQVCLDAVSLAKGETNEEFACTMMRDAKQNGLATLISAAQLLWLCNLADTHMPKRRVQR